ncbi:uncharacterized protein LOC118687417 isoform X1 [Molothrus ater]|uniref:uncharacterized protein LOC118687417 isoform X1 n=1 Tax=Molothrus ater TaxID=84834 RepID=UPI001749A945|nr:uncharacterized protein LOC118687417 isoform X1 [Molothrus ater]
MIAQHSACFHLGTSFHHTKSRHRPFHRLFFPGHMAHDPTKDRAPAYSFRGSKAPSTSSCSPGPRYFIHPSITKTGKYMPPSAIMMGRGKSKIEVTPGPSDYLTELANKHVFYTAPSNHMVFRPKDFKRFRTPDARSCGICQGGSGCLQNQGSQILNGTKNQTGWQGSVSRSGRLQHRKGCTDQGPGSCLQFWTATFYLQSFFNTCNTC